MYYESSNYYTEIIKIILYPKKYLELHLSWIKGRISLEFKETFDLFIFQTKKGQIIVKCWQLRLKYHVYVCISFTFSPSHPFLSLKRIYVLQNIYQRKHAGLPKMKFTLYVWRLNFSSIILNVLFRHIIGFFILHI